MMKNKSHKNLAILAIGILLIFLLVVVYQNQQLSKRLDSLEIAVETEEPPIVNSEDLTIAEKLSTRDFLQGLEPVSMKKLSAEELPALKAEIPVVYKDAQPGQYDIKYPGWWIVYDADKDEIISKTIHQRITLG